MDAVVVDVTMDSGMRSLALSYAVAVFFCGLSYGRPYCRCARYTACSAGAAGKIGGG